MRGKVLAVMLSLLLSLTLFACNAEKATAPDATTTQETATSEKKEAAPEEKKAGSEEKEAASDEKKAEESAGGSDSK